MQTASTLHDQPRSAVRLDPIPDLPTPPSLKPDRNLIDQIMHWIQELSSVDQPDIGFASDMAGSAFAPLQALNSTSAKVLTHNDLKRSEAFTALVRQGPAALPFLLERLDDSTPTKLTAKPIMWIKYGREVTGNPANERERAVLSRLPPTDAFGKGEDPQEHQVTVGDLCFVAIGQIVGRRYDAVRYAPTAGLVVNSPTYDPLIARAVRDVWSSPDPTRLLWESLLRDYASRRTIYQSRAATRLLFYFPQQTASLIAQRIARLQLQATQTPKNVFSQNRPRYQAREEANGIPTMDFLGAVSWCKHPAVQTQIRAAWQRASDPLLLWWAILPGLEPSDWPMVRDKLGAILDRLPRQEDGHDMGFQTLSSLRDFGGERARPLFRRYLAGASAQRCYTVCEILARTDGRWDREFLWPMLRDRRPYDGESHPVLANADEPRIPVRVCDQAAWAISTNRQNLRFELVGTARQLDGQIALLRQQLSRRDHRQ